tara:strand:+ start:9066 stop:9491 length:426 start_codon:yes stop_codon:yes gene_type:complete
MIEITPEIITAFRGSQRAFSDITKWPDEAITEALCDAFPECGGRGWGAFELDNCQNFKRRGVFYFAAHWLSVTYTDGGAANPENVTSTARLNTAAKSVGDESVSYRVTAIEDTRTDWLTLTNYGVQYLRLRRRAAIGARAL